MIVPVSYFGPLASLVLASLPLEVKVRPEAVEMRVVRRLPHRLDWEIEGDVRDDEWWRVMMMCGWSEWVCGLGFWEDLLFILTLLHALRMQTTTKLLGSLDPFIFYFSLKLIGADHGLHTSSGVQISWLAVMLRLVAGFVLHSRMPLDGRSPSFASTIE